MMPAGTEATRTAGAGESLPALMSHDLRSPLGPIALAVSAIADDRTAPDTVRELAAFASAQCSRMARIIDAALWAVRGGAPRQPPPAVDLADVARAAVKNAQALRLRCSLDDRPVSVSLEPRIGREALTALIEAAAGDDEPAWISVGQDGNASALVRITGPAIALCAEAASSDGPRDWRSAYILGATAVVEAHRGSVRFTSESIDVRFPVA